MKALTDFFTTDYGLFSAAVIAGVLIMGGYFVWFFVHEMHKDELRQRQAKAKAAR